MVPHQARPAVWTRIGRRLNSRPATEHARRRARRVPDAPGERAASHDDVEGVPAVADLLALGVGAAVVAQDVVGVQPDGAVRLASHRVGERVVGDAAYVVIELMPFEREYLWFALA